MSGITIFIIIMFIIAIIVVISGSLAYNKRLEKVTSGELRDTHSRIPEPGTTAGITYKTVLIALAIITVMSVSSVIGLMHSLNNNVNSLKSQLHNVDMDLMELQRRVEEGDRLVYNLNWEITGQDLEKQTTDLKFSLDLKQYSNDTKVTLVLGDYEISLAETAPGTFSGQVTASLFERYEQIKACIKEGNVTKVETMDFYQDLFGDVLPIAQLDCSLTTKDSFKTTKCSGWFRLSYDLPEKIEKVTVTYFVDGKEYKTIDATTEAKECKQIDLDKNVTIERDLTILVETLSTGGYKTAKKSVLVYRTNSNYVEDDYERIYDASGNLVWENEKYN